MAEDRVLKVLWNRAVVSQRPNAIEDPHDPGEAEDGSGEEEPTSPVSLGISTVNVASRHGYLPSQRPVPTVPAIEREKRYLRQGAQRGMPSARRGSTPSSASGVRGGNSRCCDRRRILATLAPRMTRTSGGAHRRVTQCSPIRGRVVTQPRIVTGTRGRARFHDPVGPGIRRPPELRALPCRRRGSFRDVRHLTTSSGTSAPISAR